MLARGDRVSHRNARESFGLGIVLQVNHVAGTALVEWDNHLVERVGNTLTKKQSHVNLTSLTKV